MGSKGAKAPRVFVRGEEYLPLVLLVTARDPLGRPHECRVVHEEQSVHLEGGEEFLIVFVNAKVLHPRD